MRRGNEGDRGTCTKDSEGNNENSLRCWFKEF